MKQYRLIIITDLDGSFLNHHNYSYQDALPLLRELSQKKIPLIFNSSKTFEEILSLREELGNTDPFIVENGAALIWESSKQNLNLPISQDYGDYSVFQSSLSHSHIIQVLKNYLQSNRTDLFKSFSMVETKVVSEWTGLSLVEAQKAQKRLGSEPLLWYGSQKELNIFENYLKEHQLSITKGGRFYHVKGSFDKSTHLEILFSYYKNLFSEKKLISLGIGDSFNDIPLLKACDKAGLIPNAKGEKINLNHSHLIQASQSGSKGWVEIVSQILKEDDYG